MAYKNGDRASIAISGFSENIGRIVFVVDANPPGYETKFSEHVRIRSADGYPLVGRDEKCRVVEGETLVTQKFKLRPMEEDEAVMVERGRHHTMPL